MPERCSHQHLGEGCQARERSSLPQLRVSKEQVSGLSPGRTVREPSREGPPGLPAPSPGGSPPTGSPSAEDKEIYPTLQTPTNRGAPYCPAHSAWDQAGAVCWKSQNALPTLHDRDGCQSDDHRLIRGIWSRCCFSCRSTDALNSLYRHLEAPTIT